MKGVQRLSGTLDRAEGLHICVSFLSKTGEEQINPIVTDFRPGKARVRKAEAKDVFEVSKT